MAEGVRTSRPAPLRRDAVLEAVTFAAERMLLAPDWHDAIEEVLARFGIAAGVSRATVVRVDRDASGALLATGETEWCAPGVPSMRDHPALQASPWIPGFERWVDAMTAGQPIVGDVATLPGGGAGGVLAAGDPVPRVLPGRPSTASGGAATGSRTATDLARGR